MLARHRIICWALSIAWAIACASGCTSKKDIQAAKTSLFNTDFAVVYSAALAATKDLYPESEDFPRRGMVRTKWHPVPLADDDDQGVRTNQMGQATGQAVGPQTSGATSPTGMPTRIARNRQYVRFDVTVLGGRPWRVRVVGHAAVMEVGNALPTPLIGAARPTWLDGRIDSLRVAIYKRLQTHAVPMPQELPPENPDDKLPVTAPDSFSGVPAAASAQLAKIKDALIRRDEAALRSYTADDVVWDLGAEPGGDVALVMWKADPNLLDTMLTLIVPSAPAAEGKPAVIGCGGEAKRVTCPAGPPVIGQFQLVLEDRGGWKITSFVRGE